MTQQPWPRDDRLNMMRNFIRVIDEEGLLGKISVGHVAATYGIAPSEVEAEMMRHQHEPEGGGK